MKTLILITLTVFGLSGCATDSASLSGVDKSSTLSDIKLGGLYLLKIETHNGNEMYIKGSEGVRLGYGYGR